MGSYLQEHSVGSIVRGTFEIYLRNFLRVVAIYVLPILPLQVLQLEAQEAGHTGLSALADLLNIPVGLFAYGAVTVAVSDLCLGNRLSIRRSYAKLMGPFAGRLFWTNILQGLLMFVGMLALVVPGLLMYAWYMFAASIVVLEGISGGAALARSKALGKEHYLRNLGVIAILSSIMFAIWGSIFLLGMAIPGFVEHWSFRLYRILVYNLGIPVLLIGMVLMYYDMRVRKEGYDLARLAEDLMR